MLTDVIPAKGRKVVYLVYAILTTATGATTVWFSALDQAQPAWVGATGAVILFVGGAFGLTAAANTFKTVDPPGRHEAGMDGPALGE